MGGTVEAFISPSLYFQSRPCGDPLLGLDGLLLAIARIPRVTVRPGAFRESGGGLRAAPTSEPFRVQDNVVSFRPLAGGRILIHHQDSTPFASSSA